jgi:phage protein D
MSAAPAKTRRRYTAEVIRRLAQTKNVALTTSRNDLFAHHATRLSGDDVSFDDVENYIIALQRAEVLSRIQAVRLQARYLRESRS